MKRREAKTLGLSRYATGKPCPHGHTGERFVSTAECCECKAAYQLANRATVNTRKAKTKPDRGAYLLEKREAARKAYSAKPEIKAIRAAQMRVRRLAAYAARAALERAFAKRQAEARAIRLAAKHLPPSDLE